jgi:hypothetical protein
MVLPDSDRSPFHLERQLREGAIRRVSEQECRSIFNHFRCELRSEFELAKRRPLEPAPKLHSGSASTQQRKSAAQNRMGQQPSVKPRIPRLAGGFGNQQAGVTGRPLQGVFFASLTCSAQMGSLEQRATRFVARRSNSPARSAMLLRPPRVPCPPAVEV